LEDFYPSSVGIRKIENMPFCFWRSVVPFSQFKMTFSQYEESKYVQPKYSVANEKGVEVPYYLDFISDDVQEGQVEILRYYNQDTDEFIIIVNGVWLNRIRLPQEIDNEIIMPIPFVHKRLPFWKSIYEPFGSDFFYGKSLPSKLSSMQDVLNILGNMLLDQGFLTIFAPILVGGTDTIDDEFLVPGRRIPVDDVNNYKTLDMKTPNSFHQYILEYTKQVLEESSVDQVQQGVAGGGDRVTATEINEAAQGSGGKSLDYYKHL